MLKSLILAAALAILAPAPAQLTAAPGANVPLTRCALKKITRPEQSECRPVAYSSLTRTERTTLDLALKLARGDDQTAAASCDALGGGGWHCGGTGWVCWCYHMPSGPECGCHGT